MDLFYTGCNVMKKILNWFWLVLLWVALALVIPGCGTRKASLNKNVQEAKQEVKVERKIDSTRKDSNVRTETVRTIYIRSDSTIIVAKGDNMTISGNNTISGVREYSKASVAKENKTDERAITEMRLTIKSMQAKLDSLALLQSRNVTKEKQVERENNGWYWVVGVLGLAGLAFWFKRWK